MTFSELYFKFKGYLKLFLLWVASYSDRTNKSQYSHWHLFINNF